MKVLFPGMGPDNVPEKRLIGTLQEPVFASLLLVRPADGQVVYGTEFIVNNGTVANRRPDDLISARLQRLEARLESHPF